MPFPQNVEPIGISIRINRFNRLRILWLIEALDEVYQLGRGNSFFITILYSLHVNVFLLELFRQHMIDHGITLIQHTKVIPLGLQRIAEVGIVHASEGLWIPPDVDHRNEDTITLITVLIAMAQSA